MTLPVERSNEIDGSEILPCEGCAREKRCGETRWISVTDYEHYCPDCYEPTGDDCGLPVPEEAGE